jgi:sporulation protein YlmC with PRC-barrel domain
MRLRFGSRVQCIDGLFGELDDVAIDPAGRRVTHLMVQPRHHQLVARLVPVELASEDTSGHAIVLHCTLDQARERAPVQKFAYLRLGEVPPRDPDWGVGIADVAVPPNFRQRDLGTLIDPRVASTYDRVPKGEVEIRRVSGVFAADGHRLGRVYGIVIDSANAITDVVLARSHLFTRRYVTVPIGDVGRLATDSVILALTRDEVAGLPGARRAA